MKVKEILEVLQVSQPTVTEESLLTDLENVGKKTDLEAEIDPNTIKKLSKKYGVDIKPIKVKKAPKEPIVEPAKEEKKPVSNVKTKVETKPVEKTKETPKKEEKQTEVKSANKREENKQVVNSENIKKPVETKIPTENRKIEQKKSKTEKSNDTVQDVELTRVYDDTYQDFEEPTKTYRRLKNVKKRTSKTTRNRQANVPIEKQKDEKILYFIPGITVAQIADKLNLKIGEIIKKLISLGYMVNANQSLERDIVEILALEFGYELKDEIETDITKFETMDIVDDPSTLVARPPIVTIMGHVDHGKTTLLDTIRNAHVVTGEAGGITQHIGAYQVRHNDELITFIDTPGHAAFTEMRARGADVTDIVIIVVAADDGVMPQTREAIEHAQAAKVPIIVAINKMDKPQANPEKIKQALGNYNLISEEWGGNTIFVSISALKGTGVNELLDTVLLVSEMEDLKANPNRLGIGTVIEAKLDKGRGVVASLLVKNGSIKVGDPIVVGNTFGKIRAMQDESRSDIKTALPSKAVEVTGLNEVPNAGDRFMVFEDEKTARLVSEHRSIRDQEQAISNTKPVSLASLFDAMDENDKNLRLIIKGDVQGTLEALRTSLDKVNVEGVKIEVVRTAVGTITETDVSLAIASGAIIIGFNIRPSSKIIDYAKEKGVELRLYNVIYKLLEDIEFAMQGMLDPVFEEVVIGQAEVRDTFKASKVGTIAGCYVTSGELKRNTDIRLIRDSIVVYTGRISSLKRFKDDVKEVRSGFECGITIENFNDIKVGDVIEGYQMEKVK
jgi:translation initiation factor IF-2